MRDKILAAMKPGITLKDMEKIGKDVFINHGLEKYWIGYVGHFVGLSVHDVGPYDKPFKPGVVFNLEPLIEDKELKIHMRLEDTIVITETGAENLTPQSPAEPEAIYKMMKEKSKKSFLATGFASDYNRNLLSGLSMGSPQCFNCFKKTSCKKLT